MTNKLAKVSYSTEKGNEITLSSDEVRSYLVKGQGNVTDSEIYIYLRQCESYKLDPYADDAFLVKYKDTTPAAIILGKGAFLKRADNNPAYDGMDFGIAVVNNGSLLYRKGCMLMPGENLMGGWCDVYRNDRAHPIHAEVTFSEYNTGLSNWKKMPATMICKVAKSQALREAFPNQFSGLYESAEMGNAGSVAEGDNIVEIEAEAAQVESAPTRPANKPQRLDKLRALTSDAKAVGIKPASVAEWTQATYGRTPEDLNNYELECTENHVSGLIDDMVKLKGTAEAAQGIEQGNCNQSGNSEDQPVVPDPNPEYEYEEEDIAF